MDPRQSVSGRLVAALREGRGEEALHKYALQLMSGNEADAEDLLQEAIVCMVDPEHGMAWEPDRYRALTHARFVMKTLAKSRWRGARKKRERPTDWATVDETIAGDARPTDEVVAQAEQLVRDRERGVKLRERLAPLVQRVFDERCTGEDDVREIARRCGCDVKEVYRAGESIAYHAEQVLAEEDTRAWRAGGAARAGGGIGKLKRLFGSRMRGEP
jgi:DNA-directed RNA polymerase specialized sigma24 family protein